MYGLCVGERKLPWIIPCANPNALSAFRMKGHINFMILITQQQRARVHRAHREKLTVCDVRVIRERTFGRISINSPYPMFDRLLEVGAQPIDYVGDVHRDN